MKINTQQNNNDMTDLGEAAVTGILMGFKSGRKILELKSWSIKDPFGSFKIINVCMMNSTEARY